MGDKTTNILGVEWGLSKILERFGFSERRFPNETLPSLDRIILDMTRGSKGVLWGAAAAGRNRVDCPGVCYSLTLDPEYTAANQLVAIDFGDNPGHPIIVRPGETIDVPNGFDHFFWTNPQYTPLVTICVTASKIATASGFAFIVGRCVGARPHYLRTGRPGSRGLAAIVAAGRTDSGAGTSVWYTADPGAGALNALTIIPLGGCRAIGVKCVPFDATPAPMAAPADLAATIRFWDLALVDTGAGVQVSTNQIDNPKQTFNGRIGTAQFVPAGESDLPVSQLSRSFEREIVGGSIALTLSVEGLAGTGVTSLNLEVEVY